MFDARTQSVSHFIVLSTILSFLLSYLPVPGQENKPITIDNLAEELIRHDVAHWEVVLAQGIVESGWDFSSALFRKTNNFIGMRVPGARPSTRIGAWHQYSVYVSWQDCVRDIKLWQNQNWHGGTRQQYIDLLQRVWAQSPDYRWHLNRIVARLDKRFAHLQQKLAAMQSLVWLHRAMFV